MYKLHVSTIWVNEEIDFRSDLHDWKNVLNDDERHFIKYILTFFSFSD
jgi:ribonucleotide reductase beta subunit family protein with ferritin-like domain